MARRRSTKRVGEVRFFSDSNLNEEQHQLTSRRIATAWVASYNESEKPLATNCDIIEPLEPLP
jgi:hypothetical protein